MLYRKIIETPLGTMVALSDENNLISLAFSNGVEEEKEELSVPIQQVEKEVEEYFSSKLSSFTTPIHCKGTLFQKRVWEKLLTISYGDLISYSELAKKVGHPKAVRAVANACAANPISLLIPCHRVIGKNGSLGGYAGGKEKKEWLLSHERRAHRDR